MMISRFLLHALLPVGTTCFSSSFVELSGVRHHVRDTGDVGANGNGPIAVLLHGFAGSTEAWDEVAPKLAAGGCRAIAIDRVGFGRTERPAPPTLPAPPPLPGREALASSLASGASERSGLLDARSALATGLRRPETLAPRLPWALSKLGEDPYSSSFATSRAMWPLLRQRIGPAPGHSIRRLFLVGHSAGGPLALRALTECASEPSVMPAGASLAGVVLIAPAALDPREDPDAFGSDTDDGTTTVDDGDGANLSRLLERVLPMPMLPPVLRKRAEVEARFAAFRALVSLPDAFGIPTVRRIADGRDIEQAVRAQMHSRMRAPERAARVSAIAAKYANPLHPPAGGGSATCLLPTHSAPALWARPVAGRASPARHLPHMGWLGTCLI